ncbi:hypothetical protein JY493_25940 [Serratia marcescens]|nr:hypothetical protein [Serratia marcescens]
MSETILSQLNRLKLYGMAEVWNEHQVARNRRTQSAEGLLLMLLEAEEADRQARSLRYQMQSARFPHHRDLASFNWNV